MEYRNLGGSGVKVSSLCLGAMTFGEHDESSMLYEVGCDEKTAFLIMNKAVDSGVNFFDTADVYWMIGYTHLLRAVAEAWLAYDTEVFYDATAHTLFGAIVTEEVGPTVYSLQLT